MRLRTCGIALGLSLVWAGPAFAANATVHAIEPAGVPSWDAQVVDILPGESVTWTFAGTAQAHNVKSASDNWSMFVPVALVPPDHTETFANEGTYRFICEVHPDTMYGDVRVASAPPPPPPPPPLSAQPFVNDAPPDVPVETGVALDTTKPGLSSLSAKRRGTGARVKLKVSEESVTKIVFSRGAKRVKSYSVAGHGALHFDAKRLRSGRYTVAVVAVDLAGNASKKRTLRVTVR